ncbi:MAG: 30S ribosomal protein S1 [Flavobacteriaceae bacterium]|nr:30S ribosomal protein S1 [Flavobacteriaceae bacterium]
MTENQHSTNRPDFDWDTDKAGTSIYSEAETAKLESLYSKTLSVIDQNQIVNGIVMAITDKEVVLNIGFKSDGLIPLSEFRDMPDLKVGDEIEVLVETTEDENGQLILSRKKALNERAWVNIVKAHEEDQIVEGFVKTRTKGGLVVEVLGLDAFLPGSQIDIKPIRDYDVYVNQTMQFKVVKLNHQFKNVVVSHKALIEDDIEAQKSDILKKLEKGQVLEGVVKNMTSFGVFIDLGGLDGLLHITDISWGRINHPEEVLKLDDKINVCVLDYDAEKNRISLGLKQLTPHPWENLGDLIEAGKTVKGKVVTVADYGAFVEIASGVEGLIHVSELSWSSHLRNPSDFMKVGDEIDAVILNIDKEERKMSLGVKQLTPDPWGNIAANYPVGSRHKGIVRNLTNYGLFVEVEPGVDGLVHVSDLSWTKKIKHPAEFVKKDQELEVIVLELDMENRRLSLGHKQLEENPWDTFESVFPIGSEHDATVMKIHDKSASLALQYGVEGYATMKQLQKEDNTTAHEDEVIKVKVIEFNKESKRIVVSHTALWREEEVKKAAEAEKKAVKDNEKTSNQVKKMQDSQEKSTLGDVSGLAEIKAKMEKTATKATPAKKEVPAVEVTPVEAPIAETTVAEAPAEEVAAIAEASSKEVATPAEKPKRVTKKKVEKVTDTTVTTVAVEAPETPADN